MKKILTLLLALWMLTGCVAMAAGNQLVVGSTTAMSGAFFTDLFGSNTADIDVRALLHGYNLMSWDHETGTYQLNDSVVAGMAVSRDAQNNRVYTFDLYGDLKFSDGSAITAKDYAFSILLTASPELAKLGGQSAAVGAILGMDAYQSGKSSVLRGVRLLSDTQMSITISKAYEPYFYEMALFDYSPYPISVLAPGCKVVDTEKGVGIVNASGTGAAIFTAGLLQKTILDAATGYMSHPSVVSGPYTLTSYDAQSGTASFAINPYYKGNEEGEKPTIETIVYRTVANDEAIDLLLSGEVDLLNKMVAADTISKGIQSTADQPFSVANYPRSGLSMISFSCERQTVSGKAVRQAIASCFDRDALVKAYTGNFGLKANGYFGIGQWMYQLAAGTIQPPVVDLPANATAKEIAAYEKTVAQWNALSIDKLKDYPLDLDQAAKLLDQDEWRLGKDGIRAKKIDGKTVALDLTLIYPEGNAVGDALNATLTENLASIGVRLTVKAVPMNELLDIYYRRAARDCDMIYLATNFGTVFDPSTTYSTDEAYVKTVNRTGIRDKKLAQLAVDMRKTEPGDVLSYCRKWVAFQERWTEVLPAIPVYSNVYFDFYTTRLQNYRVTENQTWTQAIVGATLTQTAE